MGVRETLVGWVRSFADRIGAPSFAGTPFPSGTVDKPGQLTSELGGTGTFNFGGFIRGEDPNPALDGMAAIAAFDEMRRSDSQVHAALEVVKMPICTADYEVEPADPTDPFAAEVAEFVRWNLFERATMPWNDMIRQSMLMLDFGFMLFEKVWSVEDDGRWKDRNVLHKLAPRPPKTIWQWFTDVDGALVSIKQLAVKAGSYQFLDCPASKLVRFTFQQEGDNFMGISMLRTAHPNWVIKKQFYIIDAIRGVRFGVGIPRAKMKAGYKPTETDREAIATMLQGLSSHERAFIIEAEDFEVDILMPAGVQGGAQLLPSIEHHNQQITRNILAQFLDMGGKAAGGSRALGASSMDFFLNAIESIASHFCDVINKQVVKDLVDMNFDVGGAYPKVKPVGIKETDVKSLAAAAAAFAQAGLLSPGDRKTENTIRGLLDFPDLEDAGDLVNEFGQPVDESGQPLAPPQVTGPAGTAPTNDPNARASGYTSPQEGVAARPATPPPAGQPAVSHDPRGQTRPARSNYYDQTAARTTVADTLPAVPNVRAPQAAVSTVTKTVPAEAHMARSTVPSSGDADEEGHPLREVALATRTRRTGAQPWTTPDGQTTCWRQPTVFELEVLDLREMPRRITTAAAALRNTLQGVREEQILRIASAVAHGKNEGADVNPPLVGKMASVITDAMRSIYDYGQETVRTELRRQQRGHRLADAWEGLDMADWDRLAAREISLAVPDTANTALDHLTASATVSADQATRRLLTAAQQEALRLKRAGWSDEEIEDALVMDLGEMSIGDLARLALQEINEGFSLGRVAAAEQLKDKIDKAIYSAIMDANVCEECEKLDGQEFEVGSDEYEEHLPPNPDCEGRDNCRCAYIYVLAPEGDGETEEAA